ncbi:MAG: extracellular solute-binding protein [Clostridia bacterium]
MNRKLKKIIPIAIIFVMVFSLLIVGVVAYNKDSKIEKLVIYNWADYIEPEALKMFETYYEQKTGKELKIIYSLFETNETMITEVIKGDSQIDLVCPSEYAIQKLMTNNLLHKLDMPVSEYSNLSNVMPAIRDKVSEVFTSIDVNGKGEQMNDYFVPYMWGTLGILYNSKMVSEEDLKQGWGLLWNKGNNPKLNGKILMKDSVRDIYAATMTYLLEENLLPEKYRGYSIEQLINTVDDDLLNLAEKALTDQRSKLKGYEVDFGKDDMINEVAYIDLAWSGDALWAIEESYNEKTDDYLLDYFVPETGGNIWFDGWAITTSAQNIPAAKMFIDFMCRPDIAMMNNMNIGYTCGIDPNVFLDVNNATYGEYSREALANLVACEYAYKIDPVDMEEGGIYVELEIDGETAAYDFTEYFGDTRRYPVFSDNLGVMKDFGEENEATVAMWERVKGSDGFPWSLVIFFVSLVGIIVAIFGAIILVRMYFNKRRPVAQIETKNVFGN